MKTTPISTFQPDRYPALHQIVTEGREAHSLVDEVQDEILLRIIRGDLVSGTELKSTELAEQLKVSRTPVMTALARLAADGIVAQPSNRRAIVRSGAEDWLVDIHRMRCLIEPVAARACAGQVPEKVLADLNQLTRDAKPSKSWEWESGARYFDYALHLVVAEFCGNLPMREAIRRFWSYKRLSYQVGEDSDSGLRSGYRQHVNILSALSEGDGKTAFDLMTKHPASAGRLNPGQRIL